MIPPLVAFLLYVAAAAAALLVLYLVIRLAATHALQSHSVWVHEDGIAKAIAKRDAAQAD